jgi:hypothetical protein
MMAKRAALLDHDQYVVTKVSQYVGDPVLRTSMEFLMTYADGDEQWNVFNHDLMHVEAFREYCQSLPELWPLLHSAKDYKKLCVALNKQEITEVAPGDVRYVDLRAIDQHWYNNLEVHTPNLPNEHSTIYVVLFNMVAWTGRARTKISVDCPLLEFSEDWNHEMVKSWAMYKEPLAKHVLVDGEFLAEHPDVLRSLNSRKIPTLVKVKGRKRRAPPQKPVEHEVEARVEKTVKRKVGRPKLMSKGDKPAIVPRVQPKPRITPMPPRRSVRFAAKSVV